MLSNGRIIHVAIMPERRIIESKSVERHIIESKSVSRNIMTMQDATTPPVRKHDNVTVTRWRVKYTSDGRG